MDVEAGRLVSTCAIASAAGRRLAADDEDLDAAGGWRQVREELTELKLEIAELKRQRQVPEELTELKLEIAELRRRLAELLP